MKQLFIRTQDEETKKLLESQHFTFLNQEGSFYIFLNDGIATFDEKEIKNVFYTDKLNI